MAYGIVHFFPGGTQEQYDASMKAVHPGEGALPDGQVFHAAGASPGGWTIIAIHDSQESWERFRDGVADRDRPRRPSRCRPQHPERQHRHPMDCAIDQGIRV